MSRRPFKMAAVFRFTILFFLKFNRFVHERPKPNFIFPFQFSCPLHTDDDKRLVRRLSDPVLMKRGQSKNKGNSYDWQNILTPTLSGLGKI